MIESSITTSQKIKKKNTILINKDNSIIKNMQKLVNKSILKKKKKKGSYRSRFVGWSFPH